MPHEERPPTMKRRETSVVARYGLVLAPIAVLNLAACDRRTEPASKIPPLAASELPPRAEGSAAPAPASPPTTDARVLVREEVVPGKLWVTVYSHAVPIAGGSIHLWTYASEGLWAHRQQEIRFSIKRESNEADTAFDRQLFELYKLIYTKASNAELVNVHGRTELKGTPLLGRDDFHCIIYGPPQHITGIEAHAPFLSAVIVTCEEEQLGANTGYARIFARLGAEARFFPTAFWADRKRASVVRPDERAQSILSKVGGAHVTGVSVSLVRKGGLANHSKDSVFIPGDRIVLSVRPRGAAELKQIASAKESVNGLALLLEMDSTAGTSLVWYPGQTTLTAIACPTATRDRITGNFLLIAGLAGEAKAGVNEDGFTFLFPEATWKRVHEAIAAGKPITIPGSGTVPEFVVEYVPAAYDNPIDGKRYESADGWAEYSPQGGVKKSNGPVDMSKIVLLTHQNTIEERTTTEDLVKVVNAIKTIVEAQMGTSKGPPSEVAIECELLPGKNKKFATAQRPTLDRALMQAIYEKLEKIAVPEVKGPVKFQVFFAIHGGVR